MPQGKVAVIPPCIAIHQRSAMLPLALQLYAQHPDVCTARRDVFTRAYALGPPCWTLGFRWDIHYFYSVSTSDLIYDPSGWHLPSRSYGSVTNRDHLHIETFSPKDPSTRCRRRTRALLGSGSLAHFFIKIAAMGGGKSRSAQRFCRGTRLCIPSPLES